VPDVVIAGYGPAGAAAAIAAHDAGRSVLVLESAERGGGNARYSGGFLFDVPDEAAVAHLDALCFGRTDRRVLGAYAAGLHELDGWLRSLGGTTAPFDPPPARLPAPFPSWPVGHRGNTGAGLVMAQQAGAALWHMYGCFGWFAFRTPEFPAPFAVDFFAASHVFVDADGRRFADETGYEVHDRLRALLTYLPRNPNRPRLPSWAVFDEAARLAGPLNGLLGTPNDYAWSPDNSAEIGRGWIISAASPAELAGPMGVDPEVLTSTLEQYNASARAGRDQTFGRSADTLVPMDLGRLYAIETWPGIAGTTGGPRHDERARVLRPDGQPIPGLYAAGAVSLAWGHLIEHGGGLTDAMVFGRIAGARWRTAPPWRPAHRRPGHDRARSACGRGHRRRRCHRRQHRGGPVRRGTPGDYFGPNG